MSSRNLKCTVLLCGGLGNQLFQYAFGRALSLRSGADLVLDAKTLFSRDVRYKRTYELDDFQIPDAVEFSRWPIPLQRLRLKYYTVIGKLHTKPGRESWRFIEEKTPGIYDHGIATLKLRRSSMIRGYWHSEKYFSDFETQIRDDLRMKMSDLATQPISDEIKATNSVGVHVRRRDFFSKLSIEYYLTAINCFRNTLVRPRFFVFADEPNWWRDHAGESDDITLVSNENSSSSSDFKLLSNCKHFVIANSTYSWWAAWLGVSQAKRVIAPSRNVWFGSWDLLPKTWEVIDVRQKQDSPSMRKKESGAEYAPLHTIE